MTLKTGDLAWVVNSIIITPTVGIWHSRSGGQAMGRLSLESVVVVLETLDEPGDDFVQVFSCLGVGFVARCRLALIEAA